MSDDALAAAFLDVRRAIARLIYENETGRDWHGAATDPGHDPIYLARAQAGEADAEAREVAPGLFVAPSSRSVFAGHAHCECRTPRCGHLDIRHAAGPCSFPGCDCREWR